MPLVRSQLKSDPIMERLAGHSTPELRTFAVLGWVCAVLGTGAIALFVTGFPAWAVGCICVVAATIGLSRFRKERMLVNDSETAVATVSQRTRSEGPEGGY